MVRAVCVALSSCCGSFLCIGEEGLGRQIQTALLEMVDMSKSKPKKELIHVDMGQKLTELGLAKHFPVEVRQLAGA